MIHYGNITKISGYDVPIADCIIGGSPCQDLSVAGKRAGLDGERSGLFMEQIRITKEMRENDAKSGSQMSFFAQDSSCGKTSPEPSLPTKEKTSESSSKKSPKLSKKMPLYLCLRKTNGQQAEPLWEMGGALLGEFSMHSFGESPNVDVESHLSQILEVDAPQKYYLTDVACIGILRRGRRRGKILPPMLNDALIYMIVRDTEYGQEGIADTIEILREMWKEIGEKDLKEWIQRTPVFFQSEEILFPELCESRKTTEDSDKQIVVKGDCEENNGEESVCNLRSNREIGDTPQGQKPNEQLVRQFNMLMQKLSLEDAQREVILYCLRYACESEETVSTALSTVSEGENVGVHDRDGECMSFHLLQDVITNDKISPCLSSGNPVSGQASVGVCIQKSAITLEPGIASREGGHIYEDVSGTLRANAGDNQMSVAYSIENHPADSRVNIDESGKVQTLTSRMGTGGGNVPMVMTPYRKSSRAKFSEDATTWVEADVANTLNTFDIGETRCNEVVVCGVDAYNQTLTGDKTMSMTAHSTDAHHVPCVVKAVGCDIYNLAETGDVAASLTTATGQGASNTGPSVVVMDRSAYNQGENANVVLGIDENGVACSHIAKGPGAVCYIDTSHADDVVRTDDVVAPLQARDYKGGKLIATAEGEPVICLQGNGIDRADTAGCNGKGWKEGTCYTLNTVDRPAICYRKPHYIVRRLTPLECERLQGFADGWTDIGEYTDSKGKKKKTSDSARYKALGNSIALPPWKWVLKRISAQYERDATMVSLFDGIGGFPCLWEQINGKGSTLWASEIEDFPIAVTKARIE